MSLVAENEGIIAGTIMSGHDEKRGYIQHLAIDKKYRNAGIASTLLNKCVVSLKKKGLLISHIHVLSGNELAKEFWKNRGWYKRNDIEVFSYINGGGKNT